MHLLVVISLVCLCITVKLGLGYRVVVVGGGAAGYFSAIQCAEALRADPTGGHEVMVLESGKEALAKVLISGGGRCNVMHDPYQEVATIAKHYPRGQRELLGPLSKRFGPWDSWTWFSERVAGGLKVEEDGRVFPADDRAESVKQALENAASRLQVQVRLNQRVLAILPHETSGFIVHLSEGQGNEKSTLTCDRLILASGSSRAGYDMCKQLGLKVIPPLPALFSFVIKDEQLTALAGCSTAFARLRLLPRRETWDYLKSNPLERLSSQRLQALREGLVQRGPAIITKQGLSGPAVLRLSSFAARLLASQQYKCDLEMSWLGEMTPTQLVEHFLEEKKKHPTRQLGKCFPRPPIAMLLGDHSEAYTSSVGSRLNVEDENDETDPILSRRLWLLLLQRCGLSPTLRWAEADKKNLTILADLICRMLLSISGKASYRDEFVTSGGVALSEIVMTTMEARGQPGLHLAGEVLDIDGLTGGFNFQAAWTTGFLAGQGAAQSLLSSPSAPNSEQGNS